MSGRRLSRDARRRGALPGTRHHRRAFRPMADVAAPDWNRKSEAFNRCVGEGFGGASPTTWNMDGD